MKSAPTGFCIHALAIRIHNADRLEPSATRNVTPRCCTFDKRSQPKKNKPTNVAQLVGVRPIKRQFLVVLNDNGMSIAKPQGAVPALRTVGGIDALVALHPDEGKFYTTAAEEMLRLRAGTQALKFAEESPAPEPDELYRDVVAE